ncbi:MAG: coproporphyrinogen III oxidase family protein [Spirochaetales bacterium]|nr:coproporphyrinogen III oxidase family protein [Spirochaetales bacterium]
MPDSFLDSFDFSKDLSLYIHVPFCISKCDYCAFYSVPCLSDEALDAYTARLVAEIEEVCSRMEGRPFTTAFIGGGNPGCLGAERLGRIVRSVCANGRPSEFSTEMNPESLSESFFSLFDGGLTRLSMGVQSLDPEALRFLGRNADLERTRRGLELSQKLKSVSGCTLSYDLITCLGDWHDELSDVENITSFYPSDHLSVYALTLEEGTPLYRRKPDLPDSDRQYEILKGIWELLEGKGFEHYEVSNFARAGFRCEHNCRYWAYRQYLGLGPGAASTAFAPDGRVSRLGFGASAAGYIGSGLFAGFEKEVLSDKEACEELVLMGMRYKGGLDLSRVEEFSGVSVERAIDPGLVGSLGGFRLEGGFLVPDDDGLMVADSAASTLLDRLY